MGRRGYDGYDGYGFRPYVSVAQRRAEAARHAANLAKKGRTILPVTIKGREIASTFWGKAWCENLESYSDFANRLPRGRTYVRNGSVFDLQIAAGKVTGLVSGSDIYEVAIKITALPSANWKKIKQDCSQSFKSLIDLLQGRFSEGVMERLTRPKTGLFPEPKEISIKCSCPDSAGLCKHSAAVLYGVGARLDTDPEMLFRLRKVDHRELIGEALDDANLDAVLCAGEAGGLQNADLGTMFGIELTGGSDEPSGSESNKTGKRTRKKATTPRAKAKRKRSVEHA